MILNALDEVLFWENIPLLWNFISQNTAKYFPHDPKSFYQEKDAFFAKNIPDKNDFSRRLQHYAENGSPTWVSGRNQLSDNITFADLQKVIKVSSTAENGKKKAAQAERIFANAPAFWNFYADNILYARNNTILELTIGAGCGTTAVMRNMKENDFYIGVDIDFACAKNADALAKHFGANGLGIATSLWNMPFDDEMFTCVCSNVGLEECREIPTILKEAVRVLIPGGRLVLHCIHAEKSLWYPYFAKYGFSTNQARDWLQALRLYAGIEQIENLAEQCGLKAVTTHLDRVRGAVLVFEKIDNASIRFLKLSQVQVPSSIT